MMEDTKKQNTEFVSFVYSSELLYLSLFFTTLIEFSEEILTSKSIFLTSYSITLNFKFSRFKMDFRIVFETFSNDR